MSENLDTIRALIDRWNSGERDSVLDLYTDDVTLHTAPEWPDPGPIEGKQAIARFMRDWESAWGQVDLVVDRLHEEGDLVVVTGCWRSRGRTSGLGGEIPFGVHFALRDGLIAEQHWFMTPEEALEAAADPAS
jgi:ketosteroid isomerase-like protein